VRARTREARGITAARQPQQQRFERVVGVVSGQDHARAEAARRRRQRAVTRAPRALLERGRTRFERRVEPFVRDAERCAAHLAEGRVVFRLGPAQRVRDVSDQQARGRPRLGQQLEQVAAIGAAREREDERVVRRDAGRSRELGPRQRGLGSALRSRPVRHCRPRCEGHGFH
jgi:hypothetical protein